jgi:hypothetical protein
MKTSIITTIATLILFAGISQTQAVLPCANLYTLSGTKISTEEIEKDSALTILFFWNTDNYKCREDVLELNDFYVEELKNKNIRIIAVCTGNAWDAGHIGTFVSGHNIAFEVYIDKNSDFRRAMSVPVVPFTMIINDEAESYSSYLGYNPAIEDLLGNEFKEYLASNRN